MRSARSQFLIAILATAAVTVGLRAEKQEETASPKTPTVLFMCPHGAAKSVLASAYFQRLAEERGLNVRVVSAGTDPDPQVAPSVANHLTKNGYEVPSCPQGHLALSCASCRHADGRPASSLRS